MPSSRTRIALQPGLMRASARRDARGWRIYQHPGALLWALRLALGVPMLGAGLMFGWFVIDALFSGLAGAAPLAVDEVLLSVFFSLMFAAVLLPLGWILCVARRYTHIDLGARELRSGIDTWLWRTRTSHSLEGYAAVAVGVGDLETGSRHRAERVRAVQVRLIPADPQQDRVLDVALFDTSGLDAARELGKRLAVDLRLPLQEC